MSTNVQATIIIVAIIIVGVIFLTIKEKINLKKAATGEDKEKLRNIVSRAVGDLAGYTVAYASWEWQTYQGRKTITSYWYFGIAFNADRIHIVPISRTGEDSGKQPYTIERSDVGLVNSKPGQSWVELYDKGQNEIVSLMVLAENTKEDSYHPVNIIQEEESKAFVAWKDMWMEQINSANGVTVTGKMKKPVKKR